MMTITVVKKNRFWGIHQQTTTRPVAFLQRLAIAISAIVFSTCALAATSLANIAYADYTELVVFGDNMSDTGNRAFEDPDYFELTSRRPYNDGRQSNGLLMVEHLAQAMNVPLAASRLHNDVDSTAGTNFAVAGARATDVGSPEQKAHQLAEQVKLYIGERTPPTAETLIVIAIGANDILDTMTGDIESAEERRKLTTDAISDAIEDLIGIGGRRFVVVNVANLANKPNTQKLIAAGETQARRDELTARAKSDATDFNQELVKKISTLIDEFNNDTPTDYSTEVQWVAFDLFERTEDILNPTNPSAEALRETLKIDNFQDACFDSGDSSYHEDCDETDDKINKFAFFDTHQPTDSIHKYLADELEKAIPDPPCVPDIDCPEPPCEETGTCPCEETNSCPQRRCEGQSCPPLISEESALRMILENPDPNAPKPDTESSRTNIVYVNGVAGVIRWPASAVHIDRAKNNPAFDPNYLTEQNLYAGPLWYPL